MVSKIHTKNWFNFAFLKRHLGRSWGPLGAESGRFRQIRAGPFWTSELCSRPDPPFVGPTCLQSVPKGPQNIRKVAQDVLPGPHKISMDKIPALGFFISANLKKIKRCPLSASRSLCNNHCKFKKKNISATNLKVHLFLGAAVSRERLQ